MYNSCIKLTFDKRIENILESMPAFSVVSKEPKYLDSNGVFGPLESIHKDIIAVVPDSIDNTSMYIQVGDYMSSFRNALEIEVIYDASKGSLTGGGIHIVDSFSVSFEPINLTPKYNHGHAHNILAKCSKYNISTDALYASSYNTDVNNVTATATVFKTTYTKVIVDKPDEPNNGIV